MPIVLKVCPFCKSKEHMVRDAYLSWDVAQQDWVIWGLRDTFTCNNCMSTAEPDEEVIGVGAKTDEERS